MIKTFANTMKRGGVLLVAAILALSMIPVTKAWAANYTIIADGLVGATYSTTDKQYYDDLAITPEAGKVWTTPPTVVSSDPRNAPADFVSERQGTYHYDIYNEQPGVTFTVTGVAETRYKASLETTGLVGASASLSKTENIEADETVSVTITPDQGKRFDGAPSMSVTGASPLGNLQKRYDGAYVGTIRNFTADAVVTVSGTTVDAFTATLDKTGLTGGTASMMPTENLGPDSEVVLDVIFDADKDIVSGPTVTTDPAATVSLFKQDGKTYTYTITGFTADTTVKVTGEAKADEPAKPDITIDSNGTHILGGGQGLTLTCSIPLADFVSVSVDGKTVVPSNYDAKSGSTIVTLRAAYLDSLSVGKHTATLNFTNDRAASIDFTVAKEQAGKDKLAKTGDPLDAAPIAGVVGLSVVALMGAAALRRKAKQD